MADLKTYKIDVAMDIRAYGYVAIEAEDIDKAVELATPEFIAKNFDSRGGGSDDFDYTNPRDIWLGDFECEESGEEGFVEKDLPNAHIHNGLAHDAGPELLAALKLAEKHIAHVCGETTEADLPKWFADLATVREAIAKAGG